MSWYYNHTDGQVFQLTGALKWAQDREIALEEQAAKVGVPQFNFGPFATQADAEKFKAAHPSVATQAQGAITDVTGAITGFGNQLVKMLNRILEAITGIVLLAIAANIILKQTTGVDVAGHAIKAGKQTAKAAAA